MALQVQLALLTATVKLFLKRPTVGGELVPKVLKWATEEVDNPDCRDRGFMYWRLLSTDPATAKKIVLAEKPPISTETDRMDRQLLDQLLLHAATLSSIFHRQPQTFIRGAKARYMPDSSALDETARRFASAHIYSKPAAKGPYLGNGTSSAGKTKNPLPPALAPRPDTSIAPTRDSRQGDMTNAEEDDEQEHAAARNGDDNGEAEDDPYSLLGDDFGEPANGGAYSTDAPRPRASAGAMDDLLA